jgi:dipeptidyl aminopeptidase/acylaminoacyl peptidase
VIFGTRAQYLASLGILVLKTDGRGSARRGFAFESCVWGRLGELEVDDQEAGVRQTYSATSSRYHFMSRY